MTEPFEMRVCDLRTELRAHTLVLRRARQATGAVSARHLKALPDLRDDLAIGIFLDLHFLSSKYLIFKKI